MINIIGLDPGQNGSFTLISDKQVISLKRGETESDVLDTFKTLLTQVDNKLKVYIEAVHTMPTTMPSSIRCSCGKYHKTVKVIQGGASQGKFMQGYGFLRGMLVALDIDFEEVQPRVWQKVFVEAKSKDETKTDHKNKLKAKAQLLFPDIKVTLALSDSLLIAKYGYLRENNA